MSDEKIKSMILSCIVSGIEKRVSKNAIMKGIAKYGSINNLKKHYVDRTAKRLLKQRVQPDDVQKRLLPKGKSPFTIDKGVLAKLKLLKKPKNTKKEYTELKYTPKPPVEWASFQAYVEEMTKHSCLRPDIYLDNDRYCNTCPYVQFCICRIKRVKKS